MQADSLLSAGIYHNAATTGDSAAAPTTGKSHHCYLWCVIFLKCQLQPEMNTRQVHEATAWGRKN